VLVSQSVTGVPVSSANSAGVTCGSEAAREKRKFVRMSVNYPQAVMELAVTDYQPGQEICREEANEGELSGD